MNPHADTLYDGLGIKALVAQLAQDQHPWATSLSSDVHTLLGELNHGDLNSWLDTLKTAPAIDTNKVTLTQKAVTLNATTPLSLATEQQLTACLKQLKPWRKGPFELFGIKIDTEWRSDLKWARLANHIDLSDKTVLDVGCANGYFGWRMLGAGAKSVVGIEPSILFLIQFILIKKYLEYTKQSINHHLLPYRLEDLPENLNYFDSVFSMGVLYHRRSVFDHLFELKQCLKSGGELILETLVIPVEYSEVLVPKDRYARMRNVWFIPNTKVLCDWIKRVGFVDVRVIDENQTSLNEQRKTAWINSRSLADSLNPNDSNLTIEGYPAPRRAVILARKG